VGRASGQAHQDLATGNTVAEAAEQTEARQVSTEIHSAAIVSPDAKIGQDVYIGPFSVIGPGVELGDRVHLHNSVTIQGRTRIGADCEVFPGAVLGHGPQILGFEDTPVSRLEIGERNIIREQVTIHPGSPGLREVTYVGSDCLFMVGVHIAHDCYVEDKCVFANQATLGGNAYIEEQVWLGGLAAVKQHCRIGRHAFAAGGAMIGRSVIPYGYVLGNRAQLIGLNLVGLKRRGFSRESIHDLRAAYRMLFAKEGKFVERIADTREAYASCEEVSHILDFIRTYEALELTMPE